MSNEITKRERVRVGGGGEGEGGLLSQPGSKTVEIQRNSFHDLTPSLTTLRSALGAEIPTTINSLKDLKRLSTARNW